MQYATYLMEVVMYTQTVAILEMLTVEMCMTVALPLELAKAKSKCANRKPYATSCVDNSNGCHIRHRFRDICSRIVHDRNLEL